MSTFWKTATTKWARNLFRAVRRRQAAYAGKHRQGSRRINRRFELSNSRPTNRGSLLPESLTLHSPQDYAAIDICSAADEDVSEQGATLAKDLQATATDPEERTKLSRLPKCNARLDILHFEQVVGGEEGDESEELLDPTALLLTILDTLVDMTGGVGVDPQSGAVF